ncbi:Bro-N domain-containing protein [Acinetobacter baumannii]|uniref:BRO-N domain-containing protein n=1 Tax=Acinetobacter baumannii TaxID=470 RepID=UPI0036D5B0A8
MNALVFQSSTLEPVQLLDNQVWITASDLAKALNYKQADAVTKIYNRNKEEFTENMTQVIDNPRTPNLGVRIFSLRGCHLIAMFSRTDVAKAFRKWVLDVIEKTEVQLKPSVAMVTQATYDKLALKYHRIFRQYDNMIDDLRVQIAAMQSKCHRYNFEMQVNAIPIEIVAEKLGTTVSRVKHILMINGIIEERNPYVELDKTVINITERGKKLDYVYLDSRVVDGVAQDSLTISKDGMSYLQELLQNALR